MTCALQIDNLKKTYTGKRGAVHALKGVSFSIEQGEFFGLLGPNGAGKSTLINILAGTVGKTEGSASVLGVDLDKDPSGLKYLIGVVPQEVAFDPFFTVEDTLKFQFGYYGLPIDEAYLTELLTRLSLLDKREMKPRALSGGMKRRLMIAKALIHKPKVLILDEPTAGVDIELRHELYDLVRELNTNGTTVILTSHYLEEVELLCERIAIINQGTLVALDHKHELKDRFQSTRQFSIALSNEIKEVPSVLSAFAPKLNGTELVLTFEEDGYRAVLEAVAKADLPVANFQVIEPSLEDVFLSLTKDRPPLDPPVVQEGK